MTRAKVEMMLYSEPPPVWFLASWLAAQEGPAYHVAAAALAEAYVSWLAGHHYTGGADESKARAPAVAARQWHAWGLAAASSNSPRHYSGPVADVLAVYRARFGYADFEFAMVRAL